MSENAEEHGFLQQTTSQLLHQQEALRRRREVLERESSKPPAMRFGSHSPAPSVSRSPVPSAHERSENNVVGGDLKSTSRSRAHSRDTGKMVLSRPHSSADTRRRDARHPMRFSLSYRPSPMPSTRIKGSVSPTPRGGSLHPLPQDVSSTSTAARKQSSAHRRDPEDLARSISTLRDRARSAGTSGGVRVEIFVPASMPLRETEVVAPHVPAPSAAVMARLKSNAAVSDAPQHSLPLSPTPTPTPTPAPTATVSEGPAAVTAFTDITSQRYDVLTTPQRHTTEFALPRFSQRTSILEGLSISFTPSHLPPEVNEDSDTHASTGEFPTPRPVTRSSLCLPTPVSCIPDLVHVGTHDTSSSSPVPTSAGVLASFEASAEKRCCERPEPVDEAIDIEEHHSTAPPVQSFVSTPQHRTPSPAPTPEQAMESVLRSAERRRAQRPSPTSEGRLPAEDGSEHTAPSASPQPAPTDGGTPAAPRRPCGCERPTPTAVPASQKRLGASSPLLHTPSHSPCPTVEGVGDSVMTSQRKRLRSRSESRNDDGSTHSASGPTNSSPADVCAEMRAESPTLMPQHIISSIDTSAEKKRRMEADSRVQEKAFGRGNACTPSPVPTDREIVESLLASADKRRCGRPTPPSREVHSQEELLSSAAPSSHSPHPTSAHLLRSVQLFADAVERRGGGVDGGAAQGGSTECPGLRAAAPSYPADAPFPVNTTAEDCMSAFASPALTPQHIEDSCAKTKGQREGGTPAGSDVGRGGAVRSGAMPQVGASENGGSPASSNAFASPSLTDEHVRVSLQVLTEETLYKGRSAPVSRLSRCEDKEVSSSCSSSSSSSLSHTNVPSRADDEEGAAEAPPAVPPMDATALTSQSPVFSETIVNSSQFYDCVSAPPTPAMSTPHLPAEFYQFQRDVKAISEGRVRSATPPPPPVQQRLPDFPPRVPAADGDSSGPLMAARSVGKAVSGPRDSLVLVEAAPASTQPVIQQPHLPMLSQPEPVQCHVQIPRTPTPTPQRQAPHTSTEETVGPHTATTPVRKPGIDEAVQTGEEVCGAFNATRPPNGSPLPRPVTLRSQVGRQLVNDEAVANWQRHVAAMGNRSGTNPASRSIVLDTPTPTGSVPQNTSSASRQRRALQETSLPLSLSPREGRSTPYPREALSVLESLGLGAGEVTEWQHRIEDDDQIFAVSPQANVVVRITPALQSQSISMDTSTSTRKRPRSASGTNSSPLEEATETLVQTELESPVSVEEAKVPSTSRGSGGGRRSQLQQLLDMLPTDVAQALELSGSTTTSSAFSTPAGASEPNITAEEVEQGREEEKSGISQRVSQRHSLQELDATPTSLRAVNTLSSAERTRPHTSPRVLAPMETPTSSRGIQQAASRSRQRLSYSGDTVQVSPLTPGSGKRSSSRQGGRKVVGTTRLSAELKTALFRQAELEAEVESQVTTKAANQSPPPAPPVGTTAKKNRKRKKNHGGGTALSLAPRVANKVSKRASPQGSAAKTSATAAAKKKKKNTKTEK